MAIISFEQPDDVNPNDVTMPFGKYRGQTLGWIAENDVLYLDWLTDCNCDETLKDAILAVAEEYGQDIEEVLENRRQDWKDQEEF